MKSNITYLQAMKTFSAVTIGAALALPLSSQTPAVQTASDAPMQKPNIIVILADDYGWGSLGCYGGPETLKTPNLDRLAVEGRRFTNAYAPSSVCSPTRFALMTGRYDWRTRGDGGGVIGAFSPLSIETNRLTLASLCKSQGYRTAVFGKWHLGIGNPPRTDWNRPLTRGPQAIGFDYFFGIAANAWNGPHAFIENDSLLGRIPGETVRVMENYSPTNYTEGIIEQYDTDLLMDEFTKKTKEWIGENSSEPFFVFYSATAVHKPHDYHPRFTGSPFGKYGNFIEELDWCVGQILDQLDSLNLADNTLIIFTSDNGGVIFQGDPEIKYAIDAGLAINGPLRGGKHSEYDGGFREPFLVRWPGKVPAGTVSDQIISVNDILATLAGILDVPLPNNNAEDSFNALRLLTEETPGPPIRDHFIMHAPNSTYAIRMGDWRLVERKGAQNELYNLKEDIRETRNVIAANADRAAQMQMMLSEARDRGYTRPDAVRRYDIQLEFINSSSGNPVEELAVVFMGKPFTPEVHYTTDSLGLTPSFKVPNGQYKIALTDPKFQIVGNDIIGVSSDAVIRVYVKEVFRFSVELEFLDSLTRAPLAELELLLTDSTYVTNSLGKILIPELFEGNHTLELPDNRFRITGDPVIELRSDTMITILVTKLTKLTLQVINRTSGSPIYRAVVKVNDSPPYYSNRSGIVEVGEFPTGPFHVSVSFSGYFLFSDTLFFSGENTMILSLTPENASVTFRVSDTTGPVSNARVIMTGSQLTNFSGQTFFLNQPARKNHTYSVEKAGYSTVQDSFYLEIDTTLEVSLEKVVGISDKDAPGWTIYPNPFDSYIQINLQEKAQLNLYDISGILRFTMKLEEGLNKMPTAYLEKGFYMVEIVSSGRAYKKVMVK